MLQENSWRLPYKLRNSWRLCSVSIQLFGSGNTKGREEAIAHSKYWIPGFKFQTLEIVVRLIWMCCKWTTIDPPNIVPTTSSEFSLYPLWPPTNQSSVLWPLDQSEHRIWEPSSPYWLLVWCQQEQEGEWRVFWFRCYPVILCYSRHSRLTFQTRDLLPEFSLWKLMLGTPGGTLFKVSQIYFLQPLFCFWVHFWHIFVSTSLNIWHQCEEKLFFYEIQPASQTNFQSSIKSEHKMKARITMNVPSQLPAWHQTPHHLLSANMRWVRKTTSVISIIKWKVQDNLDVLA